MHNLFLTLIFCYGSANFVEIGQNLTELESNMHCPVYVPQPACSFSLYFIRWRLSVHAFNMMCAVLLRLHAIACIIFQS